MFGDMMEKLSQMKQSVKESKARLDTVSVKGESAGFAVTVNGNRKVIDIKFPASFDGDNDEIQDMLVIAFNRALEAADKVNEAEMAAAAKGILPNIPGL
jgi:nucleoid-associated protein EbfC